MRFSHWLIALLVGFGLVLSPQAQANPLRVVATTTIIADIGRNVGGDLVEIMALVPPDTDVHAFEARPADLVMLAEANVILANGVGLEGFLSDILENVAVEPVIVGEGVRLLAFGGDGDPQPEAQQSGILGDAVDCTGGADESGARHGNCDPHIWANPRNAMVMAANIAAAFAQADPDNAEIYHANAAAYIETLESLDEELETLLSTIPDERRVLVTSHEFLGYFAARYDFQITGTVIPGVSTLAEPDPRALAALGDLMREEGLHVIFAELSDSGGLSSMLAAEVGATVQVVALYSGALSAADGPAATYIDYMRFNVGAIVAALSA